MPYRRASIALHVLACLVLPASAWAGWYEASPRLQGIVDRAVAEAVDARRGVTREDVSVTLVDVAEHLRPVGAQHLGERLRYPASVVKVFFLAAAYDLPVMMHTCGSSSWAYEEYIKLGLAAVDTLQPEATDMSPEHLKKTFGGRLAFHGCISTAGPVATGTVEETIEYCQNTLNIMMPGGGYCFAPTHSLQDNSPTENVVAMYETAREYGRY